MARRILVIDDDAQIRAVASATLSLVGMWEVSTASSGEEGIAQAAAGRPDAILLDVMMPDMDGRTTLRRLRASPTTAEIPVIMLTATLGPDGTAPIFDQPVAGVLGKPFDIMGLAGDVAAVLGWDT
ncbi:MAG TPA: response regulator [Acidimicrobiales bacterium]|nr:response regulator [Acidimicrobiales bacterium]